MNKMKSTTRLLLLMTLFVVSAIAFTACSSEDDLTNAEQEQTLGDAIKAQFTISIPTEAKGMTRQSSTIVNSSQSISDFRGITFIKLYPSSLGTSDFEAATTQTIGKNTSLTNLIIPGTPSTTYGVSNYIPNDKLMANNNSVLYGDVQLRIGTKSAQMKTSVGA